jgi:hypothetical protein
MNMKIKLGVEITERSLNDHEFLEEWVATYIHQELLRKEEADDLYSQCLSEARSEGINQKELNDAAGGNLVGYLRLATRLAHLLRKTTPAAS